MLTFLLNQKIYSNFCVNITDLNMKVGYHQLLGFQSKLSLLKSSLTTLARSRLVDDNYLFSQGQECSVQSHKIHIFIWKQRSSSIRWAIFRAFLLISPSK
jgi:hypothetical protein